MFKEFKIGDEVNVELIGIITGIENRYDLNINKYETFYTVHPLRDGKYLLDFAFVKESCLFPLPQPDDMRPIDPDHERP